MEKADCSAEWHLPRIDDRLVEELLLDFPLMGGTCAHVTPCYIEKLPEQVVQAVPALQGHTAYRLLDTVLDDMCFKYESPQAMLDGMVDLIVSSRRVIDNPLRQAVAWFQLLNSEKTVSKVHVGLLVPFTTRYDEDVDEALGECIKVAVEHVLVRKDAVEELGEGMVDSKGLVAVTALIAKLPEVSPDACLDLSGVEWGGVEVSEMVGMPSVLHLRMRDVPEDRSVLSTVLGCVPNLQSLNLSGDAMTTALSPAN